MIALQRVRTAEAINEKFRGIGKKAKDKELLLACRSFLANPVEKIEFKSTYWKTAKKQLKKESNGKCAYCEANTEVVAHGDVEHYRPKDIYWWLAYTYDNYLYACQICNQTYKGVNFPITAATFAAPLVSIATTEVEIEQLLGNISPDPLDTDLNYTLKKYLASHKKEKAHLINPYVENPEKYFAYEADDTLEEVKVVPAKAIYAKHIKAAEDFYGINRIELKNARYATFRIFRLMKKSYKALSDEPTKKDVKKQIDDMLSRKYLFAGINRFFDTRI